LPHVATRQLYGANRADAAQHQPDRLARPGVDVGAYVPGLVEQDRRAQGEHEEAHDQQAADKRHKGPRRSGLNDPTFVTSDTDGLVLTERGPGEAVDRSEHPHPAAARRARRHVDREHPLHQLGPAIVA